MSDHLVTRYYNDQGEILYRPTTWRDFRTGATTLAHFARVLGIDFDESVIYLDNTLNKDGEPFKVDLYQFLLIWDNPEMRATSRPSPNPQELE